MGLKVELVAINNINSKQKQVDRINTTTPLY